MAAQSARQTSNSVYKRQHPHMVFENTTRGRSTSHNWIQAMRNIALLDVPSLESRHILCFCLIYSILRTVVLLCGEMSPILLDSFRQGCQPSMVIDCEVYKFQSG